MGISYSFLVYFSVKTYPGFQLCDAFYRSCFFMVSFVSLSWIKLLADSILKYLSLFFFFFFFFLLSRNRA